MDAFFASVEVRSDPRLAGVPLLVGGGPGDRGVVTTASYAARRFGIRSGMALVQARRLCPEAMVLPVDPPKYVHESLRVLSILERFSPRVEPASIDEAYLEMEPVEESAWAERARAAAMAIRRAVREERGLSCSVGAGGNKLQAKMASKRAKPGGVWVVEPERFREEFGPLPVSVLPGVGERTVAVLSRLGIATVADLADAEETRLRSRLGKWGAWYRGLARGEDPRPVIPRGEEPAAKSAGHEITFLSDRADPGYLRATIWLLADRVARRLRRHRLAAGTVVVRFKVGRKRYSRQRALPRPTDEAATFAAQAWRLLESTRRGRALRLLGVAGAALHPAGGEEALFPEERRRREALRAGDRLRDRFGEGVLLPAGVLLRKETKP